MKKTKANQNLSLWLWTALLIWSILAISGRAPSSAWPASPTCRWRASWSAEHAWSLWASCLRPTPCFTGICTSWRTRSGTWLRYTCREAAGICPLVSWRALGDQGCVPKQQIPFQEHPRPRFMPQVVAFLCQLRYHLIILHTIMKAGVGFALF